VLIDIKVTSTCFGVNAPSSGSLQLCYGEYCNELKLCGRKQKWPKLRRNCSIFREGLRKIVEKSSQDRWFAGRVVKLSFLGGEEKMR
jgi:hypothetical protein